ncbi:MAG: prohibitin family protein [Phycisphaerales bacterium]|nr:prohibitin family protein [Phycisphaerae bacterium]NNF43724.1 prohibitin family protein [Phycisphaerales bacterium]NNM25295.1 prohibitin family protein [Phycisphaerales bacterium]
MTRYERPNFPRKAIPFAAVAVILIVVLAPLVVRTFRSVPAGHVAVATLFGKIQEQAYEPGLHFPVNPLYKWHEYDARQKTHKETAGVPSQDQLTTTVDVSVQYRLIGAMASAILAETGTTEQAVEVHLIPKVRSVLREQGKSIKRAEDFFLEETQQQLQVSLKDGLGEYLRPNGIEVSDVLIREITLPARLVQQIEQKKQAEQEAEQEKAKLEKKATEFEQVVKKAEADRRAAEEEAMTLRVLADAEAYKIEMLTAAIAQSPAYIQLQAIEALRAISQDPAAKMYFLSSDSPMPLPLMHMGEPVAP